MVRARTAIRWAISGLCAGLLTLPAAAGAATDGGATAPGEPTASGPAIAAPTAVAGALAVAPASLLEHQVAVISGTLAPVDAGRTVWLQVRQGRGSWSTVLRAQANAAGAFAISWRASRAGALTLRVVASDTASASSVTATPQATLAVYQEVFASWYGPGFYGNRTACGEKLTRSMVGIADRTLPCGTAVSLTYDGRSLTLPVIDRGPYANGATIDLTHAAAQELGITETVPVAMLSLSGSLIAPASFVSPSGSPTGATGATGTTGFAGTSLVGGATAPSA
ncbi:MAG: septal ring lytic transglycosylase RlpA family protein [Solirubrobacteraceae bacterium]